MILVQYSTCFIDSLTLSLLINAIEKKAINKKTIAINKRMVSLDIGNNLVTLTLFSVFSNPVLNLRRQANR